MKRVADGLTALRFVVVVPMIWIAFVAGPSDSLAPEVWLTIVAWTSDWLDGPLARLSKSTEQTWLGRHDLEADLAIVVAQAAVMVSWGVALPALASLVIVGGWVSWLAARGKDPVGLITRGLWTNRKSLEMSTAPLQVATFVVYGGFMVTVWTMHAALGRLLAGWLAATLLISPGRSWHRVRSFFVVVRRFVVHRSGGTQLEKRAAAEEEGEIGCTQGQGP